MTPQEIKEKPTWDDVMSVLRSDKLRGYRVDIETDSTVEPDATEEKQASIEFMSGATQFFQGAGPIIQAAPETTGMFLAMFKSAAKRFKPGRELEDKIDEAADALEARAKQALQQAQQGPPPDPKAEEAKMKMQLEMKRLELETEKTRMQMQLQQQQAQADIQHKQAEMQADIAVRRETAQTDAQIEMEKAQLGAETDLAKAQLGAETDLQKAEIASRAAARSNERGS